MIKLTDELDYPVYIRKDSIVAVEGHEGFGDAKSKVYAGEIIFFAKESPEEIVPLLEKGKGVSG